jgi:hypothetical protein
VHNGKIKNKIKIISKEWLKLIISFQTSNDYKSISNILFIKNPAWLINNEYVE